MILENQAKHIPLRDNMQLTRKYASAGFHKVNKYRYSSRRGGMATFILKWIAEQVT